MNNTQVYKQPGLFPISRDPPEGGTLAELRFLEIFTLGFQFLGIPPKGEQ